MSFPNEQTNPNGAIPATTYFPKVYVAITPSDVTVYDPPIALYCTANGNVVASVLTPAGTYTDITRAVFSGNWFPGMVRQVKAATTATLDGWR